jgi:hypothetical protein
MNYTNNYDNDDGFTLYNLFSAFTVIFSASLFSFSVIGNALYTRVGDDYNFFSDSDSESDSEEDEEDTQEKYARLYYDELNDLEDRVLEKDELEKLEKTFIKEKTPNGMVIMSYNNKSESFCYYCDDKNIRYMVLDTVARKYTIDNKCKSICVNYKAEFEKAKAAIVAETKTSTNDASTTASNASDASATSSSSASATSSAQATSSAEEAPVVKKSIYARFKNYNAPPQKKRVSEDNKQQQPEKIYILTEKANRFTYKGKLSNYKDPNEVVTTVFNKTVDFATFKKMCAENAIHKNE